METFLKTKPFLKWVLLKTIQQKRQLTQCKQQKQETHLKGGAIKKGVGSHQNGKKELVAVALLLCCLLVLQQITLAFMNKYTQFYNQTTATINTAYFYNS